jgi:hypothetical protein
VAHKLFARWMLPLEGERKPVPFLVTEFVEVQARFSPDGRWVAYSSNESGSFEVYLRSFSVNSGRTGAGAGVKLQSPMGTGLTRAGAATAGSSIIVLPMEG